METKTPLEIVTPIVDALHEEARAWPEETKTKFFLTGYNEENLISYHHGFGRYIRNTYKLWETKWEPELKEGADYSPYHPDSLSMLAIQELWKRGLPK